jgi:hypothetical protein
MWRAEYTHLRNRVGYWRWARRHGHRVRYRLGLRRDRAGRRWHGARRWRHRDGIGFSPNLFSVLGLTDFIANFFHAAPVPLVGYR